VNKQQAKQQAR